MSSASFSSKPCDLRRSHEALHDRGIGSGDHVVLILAQGASSLALQDPDDAEWKVLDADTLADRAPVREQTVGHRPAEHADLGAGLEVGFGEEAAGFDVPRADERPIYADAIDGGPQLNSPETICAAVRTPGET